MRNRKSLKIILIIILLTCGFNLMASTPTAWEDPPSNVTSTGAILRGYVNPGGESTTVTIEWGTTAAYGNTVSADQSPVSGSSDTLVTYTLSGLTPTTQYFYRVTATNASGSSSGEGTAFYTLADITATTLIATPVTTTTATLNGNILTISDTVTVTFEYGTTTAYGTTVSGTPSPVTFPASQPVSANITGLTPNTEYHFRVVGTTGSSHFGDDMTFFTSAPAAPTITTERVLFTWLPNQVILKATANANNADSVVTFEYGTVSGVYGAPVTGTPNPVVGVADTEVSYTLGGLTPDTMYYYRAVATNSQGVVNGAEQSFYNTTAPYAETVAATNVYNDGARLNGTISAKEHPDNIGTTVVTFEYGLTVSYGTTVTVPQSPVGGNVYVNVDFNLTGLSPNTLYHYRVVATNANGTETGADMTFTTTTLPIVSTETAAPVGTTTATLNGTVNANGDSTTVTFEYGTTTSYGTTITASQSPVTGSTDMVVSRAISGLTNGIIYHYRVVGTNGSGTVNGSDMTFTTGVSPPSVTTNSATLVANTTAVLNGTINANGFSTMVTFEWGTTSTYGRSVPGVPGNITGSTNTPVAFNMTGLTPGTLYHYRVVGVNSGGTIYGADMTFTTSQAPIVVTNAATSVNTTIATLNGTVNAVGQSTTVTFEYGTDVSYGTTVTPAQSLVTGSADTPVSNAITGLTPGTTYHYRVVGVNVSGTSYGADMTFFTGAAAAPTATTDAATNVLSDGATLNGRVNANNDPATVTFEYGTTIAYGTTVTADQSPVTGAVNTPVSFAVTGLANNTTYHYRVVATNTSGTVNGADMTFSTGNLPVANTGTATNLMFTTVTLNGIINNNNNVTFTNIYFDYGLTAAYGTSVSGTPSTATGTADTNSMTPLTGLTPNTTYHYRIRGQSAYGTTNGADMTFTTPIGPDAVTNAATSVGSNSATFNGTVNPQNASTIVTFEYGLDTSYGQTVVATQSPITGATNTAVSFTSNVLAPSTTYHFRVIASNANGTVNGADMNFTTTASVPTAVTYPASGVSSTAATMNGIVNANNDSTTVTFEYGLTTAYGTTLTAAQSPVTGNANTAVSAVTIATLTANTTYHYRVVAQNGTGTTNGADMTFFTGISAPVAITNAESGVGSNFATLNGLVNANNASTIVTFEIGTSMAYGSTVTAIESPLTGSLNTLVSFNHTGLIGSTTYHYRVVAQNAAGTTYGINMSFTTNPTGAPIVVTGNASLVAGEAATLNGVVNPNTSSTVVSFEFGTTTSYGRTITADQSPLLGSVDQAVSGRVFGLSANTTYHYRVIGSNINGDALGDDMTFTTGVDRPLVRTDEATDINNSGATLNGMVNPRNLYTTILFEYGLDSTYGSSINGTPPNASGASDQTISAVLGGLIPNTTYHFRIVGQNSEGRSFGIDRIFYTGSSDPAEIELNREKLNFGNLHGDSSNLTPAQTLLINNNGGGTLNWEAISSDPWIIISANSGSGNGIVDVSVDPTGMDIGKHRGSITVSEAGSGNSTKNIEVVLNIFESSSSPFGDFTSPLDNSMVSGSVPITGWVIDDIFVEQIKIYREEKGLLIYIGDAAKVDGARPDIEHMYPDYPENFKAGWGYMLLTNLLPDGGNGTFTLYVKATDIEGNDISLGSKTITSNNANAVNPFGAIDTPSQGGIASGENFVNSGWVLTPQPNYIPEDGSTINVYIDGVKVGNPLYNVYREDIGALFPGYSNSNGAGGNFIINTLAYSNGVHTIQWTATDSAGNVDGIGSRYFSILNTGSKKGSSNNFNIPNIESLPVNTDHLINVEGKGLVNRFASHVDDNGVNTFKSRELLPIEIKFIEGNKIIGGFSYYNEILEKLPPGLTLDQSKGVFYWTPPVGFCGKYTFVFIIRTESGQLERKYINIDILSKFSNLEQ